MPPIDDNQLAPPRQSFRNLFLTIGCAVVGIAAVFYFRTFREAPDNMRLAMLAIPGGIGLLLIVIGLLCPRPQTTPTTQANERAVREAEVILKRGPANYSRRWEKAGGHLCLTNQRLAFLGHGINIQDADVSIPLAEIDGVDKAMTMWIIPNGLRVRTARGDHHFVLFGRQAWMDAISRAKEECG